VDPGCSCGGEIALLGVVHALAVVDALDELWDEEVEITVALAMSVSRHVDRDTIHESREIGAMVEVEATQEILVSLAVPAVLSHDEPRHGLEHLRRTQQRTVLEYLLRSRSLTRGIPARPNLSGRGDDDFLQRT